MSPLSFPSSFSLTIEGEGFAEQLNTIAPAPYKDYKPNKQRFL
jgi:hypothetical protein